MPTQSTTESRSPPKQTAAPLTNPADGRAFFMLKIKILTGGISL
jgi:hypothetical protein